MKQIHFQFDGKEGNQWNSVASAQLEIETDESIDVLQHQTGPSTATRTWAFIPDIHLQAKIKFHILIPIHQAHRIIFSFISNLLECIGEFVSGWILAIHLFWSIANVYWVGKWFLWKISIFLWFLLVKLLYKTFMELFCSCGKWWATQSKSLHSSSGLRILVLLIYFFFNTQIKISLSNTVFLLSTTFCLTKPVFKVLFISQYIHIKYHTVIHKYAQLLSDKVIHKNIILK